LQDAVCCSGIGAPGGRALPNDRLQNRGFGFYSLLRSEFFNYAVGPWVSVAGREAALARGNPAKKMKQWSIGVMN
jgi:hypothetical protein